MGITKSALSSGLRIKETPGKITPWNIVRGEEEGTSIPPEPVATVFSVGSEADQVDPFNWSEKSQRFI